MSLKLLIIYLGSLGFCLVAMEDTCKHYFLIEKAIPVLENSQLIFEVSTGTLALNHYAFDHYIIKDKTFKDRCFSFMHGDFLRITYEIPVLAVLEDLNFFKKYFDDPNSRIMHAEINAHVKRTCDFMGQPAYGSSMFARIACRLATQCKGDITVRRILIGHDENVLWPIFEDKFYKALQDVTEVRKIKCEEKSTIDQKTVAMISEILFKKNKFN